MPIEIVIIIILMGLSIFLLLLEVFFLPGITVAGIGGALCAIGGIIYAYTVSSTTGHITLGASVIIFCGIFLWMLRSNSFNKIMLKTDIDSKITSVESLNVHVGDEGITMSRLAPIGKARFEDIIVEAKAQEDFIDEKQSVVIIGITGNNVIVKPIKI